MAATPGTFTPSQNYADFRIAYESMFAEPGRIGKEFDTPIGTVAAITENANYEIQDVLNDAFTNRTVKVNWLEDCSVTPVNAGDTAATCTISGEEIGSDSQEFDKNFDFYLERTVKGDERNDLRSVEEKLAYTIELAKRNLENKFNEQVLSTIESNFNSSNDYGDLAGGTYDSGTGVITYDPASWTADLIAEFDLMAQVNQIVNPVFLHGTNLYKEVFLANSKACCDNEGDRNLFGVFGHYWDTRQFITTYGTSTKPSYAIEPNSVVVWNAYQFENETPQHRMDSKNTHTWREPSTRLRDAQGNPFYFDIVWQRDCGIAGDGLYSVDHEVRVHLRGGIDIAPNNCSAGTGILKFLNA